LVLERRDVSGVVALGKQRGVQARVERLHPAVEDLRRAGEVGDVGDLQARLADRRRGPAGRKQLDAEVAQAAREVDQAGLVGHRDERPADVERAAARRRAALARDLLIDHSLRHGAESIPAPAGTRGYSPLGAIRTRRGFAGSKLTRPAAISRTASGRSSCSVAWIASSSSARSRDSGTGTARWRRIGPVSTPSSTKCTVTPVTRTPWSSACPIASRPGKDGR